MGYIYNEYVVVSISIYSENYEEITEDLRSLQQNYKVDRGEYIQDFGSLITGPLKEISNSGRETWIMTPDGSKEGWDTSNQSDILRQQFIETVNRAEYRSIIHFCMGGDDMVTRIIYQSDEEYD